MHPWLRRLFVWLVALALPVQGMAGVARLHCASSPQPAAAVTALAHADHVHHGGGHGGHVGQGQGEAVGPGAVAADDGVSPAPGAAHKCSACAACTVGAALPPARTVVPQPEPEPPAPRASPLPAISFIASGPERPPRSPRA